MDNIDQQSDEDTTRSSELLGDTVAQSEVLESLASAVNYNRWLTDLARPHLGDSPIELGSGLGDYAQAWLDSGVPRITTTEIEHVPGGEADDVEKIFIQGGHAIQRVSGDDSARGLAQEARPPAGRRDVAA